MKNYPIQKFLPFSCSRPLESCPCDQNLEIRGSVRRCGITLRKQKSNNFLIIQFQIEGPRLAQTNEILLTFFEIIKFALQFPLFFSSCNFLFTFGLCYTAPTPLKVDNGLNRDFKELSLDEDPKYRKLFLLNI